MDGVAVGTISQQDDGRELLAASEDSTADSDASSAPEEKIIWECTEQPLGLPSAPVIGGIARHPPCDCFAVRTMAFIKGLEASVYPRD
jgi:hypothetical protein